MKKIYSLEIEHEDDPKMVELAQNLTLDKSRPTMGLAGEYGLYGSPEWWKNLYDGLIPKKVYEGTIGDIKFSGMNNEGKSFTLKLINGGSYTYSCEANRRRNLKHYKVGRRAKVVTFMEKLKKGSEHEFVWQIEVENA